MAGTLLNLPFDSEIFDYQWKNAPDVVLTSIFESGAVTRDPEIETLISNGSNFFTVPFYDVLGGTEQNYNGATNFTTDELTGGVYSGCVFSRMKAWKARDFVKDFNSGADPMEQIVNGVAQFWNKKRQARLVSIIGAIFGITGDTDWALHTSDISVTTSIADSNKISATSIGDAIVKACGDNASGFSLAIMHSVVAGRLAGLQLLEYAKYTDARGIEKPLPIGYANGMLVIVNDNVPVTAVTGGNAYTTYILGDGAIRYASAPVDVPSEMFRDPATNGGQDTIYTRVREVIHPYGFSFKGDVATDVSVPDSVLTVAASYERKLAAKSIKIARLITNG